MVRRGRCNLSVESPTLRNLQHPFVIARAKIQKEYGEASRELQQLANTTRTSRVREGEVRELEEKGAMVAFAVCNAFA